MTAIVHNVEHVFRTYHVPLDNALTNKLASLSYESKWCNSNIWFSHATELDSTTLYYMLPDRYEALKLLTGLEYEYVEMRIGDIKIFALGLCCKPKPFGPFFNNTMAKNLGKHFTSLSLPALYEIRFAIALNDDMKTSKNRMTAWKQSYSDSFEYLTIHRHIVQCVGKALDIPMLCHDLTKTTLVSIALGRLYHWSGDQETTRPVDCALDVVRECHQRLENHHPQHDNLDKNRLFVDRISVRIQKEEAVPEKRGFDVKEAFIPRDCACAWDEFKQKYARVNLYDFVTPHLRSRCAS